MKIWCKTTKTRKNYVTVLLMAIIATFTCGLVPSLSASTPRVEILPTHSGYINDDGFFYVVGEIENTGDVPVEKVNVTATFYNSSGEFVAFGSGTSTLNVIIPGRRSPFEITLYSGLLSRRVHSYVLSITSLSPTQTKPLGLEILNHFSYIYADVFHVEGVIKNIGSIRTSYVKVIATFYNASGYVIATNFTYSDPRYLDPEQEATFHIVLNSSMASKVHHYILEAESLHYVSVPEFNIMSLTLILTLFVILLLPHSIKIRGRNHLKFG